MRSKEQLESWKKKDPILRLKKSLVLKKILNNEDQNKIETKIENMINKIVSATLKIKIDTLTPHHKFL
jgi:TPP-dependent pyruvate/acetoin dehydrogenase alpha subunit